MSLKGTGISSDMKCCDRGFAMSMSDDQSAVFFGTAVNGRWYDVPIKREHIPLVISWLARYMAKQE